MKFDYREMLKKYIDIVSDAEGISYFSTDNYTKAEYDEMIKLSNEPLSIGEKNEQ